MQWHVAAVCVLSCALSASASVCDDSPCTPDVLLFGTFNGTTVNTSALQVLHSDDAPAVVQGNVFSGSLRTTSGFAMAHTATNFPDTYGCRGLLITAKSVGGAFAGYTLAFGTGEYAQPGGYSASSGYANYSQGYKANFSSPGVGYSDIYLPLEDFSRAWAAPGVPPVPDCHHDTSICPTFMQMQNVQVLSVWAEGVEGSFEIHIESIRATSCYQPGREALPRHHVQRPTSSPCDSADAPYYGQTCAQAHGEGWCCDLAKVDWSGQCGGWLAEDDHLKTCYFQCPSKGWDNKTKACT